MRSVLLDSDVILDFFFDRKPHAEFSTRVLTQIELGKVKGYVTAVIISNCYYLLRQTSTHERVIKKLNLLMTLTDMLAIDKAIVLKAMNSKFNDFEDALQNYSCESDGTIDIIITRNTKDFKHSLISVMTPKEFCNMNAEQ